jgi:hypothetical protein
VNRVLAGLDAVRRLPRNADYGELQEIFLVCAVATILVIRTQLWLTNYPQLGGGGLHIAHLLWGGVFMVIAIGLLLSYLGRPPRVPAAIVGGVGFGFFIDELGKFVTSDNNYFFKPAAALIYLIFVGLFLLTAAMRRQRGFSSPEYVMNAIEFVAEAVRRDLDQRQRKRALEFLAKANPSDPLVDPLLRLVRGLDAAPTPKPSAATRFARAVRARYFGLIGRPRFRAVVGWLFALWAGLGLLKIVELILSLGLGLDGPERDSLGELSFINFASLASSLASAALVAIGLYRLRTRTRLDAYRMFDRALMVSILMTQVFAFVESQFAAVFGLGIDVLLLVTLRYMAAAERHLASPEATGPEAPQAPVSAPARATS